MTDDLIEARPASRIAPITGTLGLRWQTADRKWWLEGSATLARHQDRLSPGDVADTQRIPPGGTKGYQVYAVRGGWNPCGNLKLFAAWENIGNEDYRYLGSGNQRSGHQCGARRGGSFLKSQLTLTKP